MGDLISREAAIEAIGERPLNWTDTPGELQAISDWDGYIAAIKSVPAVDAVPVVRCKDCKYGQPDATKYGQLWCDWFYAYNPVSGGKEGYCSQAKR